MPLLQYKKWLWGLLLPTVLAASLAWPVDLERQEPARSVRVTDRDGGLLREIREGGRGRPVHLEAISPAVIEALIATEDRHFYRHPGVNPLALLRAAWMNTKAGRVVSGGSTITMQVARVLRGRQGASLVDKLAEMHLALRLELRLSKEEILALWLEHVPFGNETYGIEAAARLYFGKAAKDLTTSEAAFLVGLPQSPSRYNPFRHIERAQARQRRVLQAMERNGVLQTSERQRLEKLPVDLAEPEATFRAPLLTSTIAASLSAGGDVVDVRTTLDGALQQTVERLAKGHLERLRDASVTNAAVLVLDNTTGEVLAYVGSVNFWDVRAGGQNDGVRMRRQPGSALKPFTYAHALATRRYTTASILPDLPLQVLEAGGAFSPANYDNAYHGPVALREALANSYNVPAVRLAREIGPGALLGMLRQSGFASLDKPAQHYGVGLTLGSGEVTLWELARAYAGLARGGTLPDVHAERWRRTAQGDTLRPASASIQPSGISPQVAYLITDVLRDPEARAAAFGRGGPLELPFPCAVKTGTSKDYRDNWTVGYTPRHTVAVWVGNFDGAPMRWVSGVTGAGPLFHAVMRALGPSGDFTRPAGLAEATICPASGKRLGTFCSARQQRLFLDGTAPTDTCDVHQRFRLDRRTGRHAGAATPPEAVEEKTFAVYPPAYHAWMREHGWPLPPTVRQEDLVEASPSEPAITDRLQVQYPESGTAFRVDPVLRSAYQKIHLSGSAAEDLLDVHWRVDGRRLVGGYQGAALPLEPGTHRIELWAVDEHGHPLRSRTAVVKVSG